MKTLHKLLLPSLLALAAPAHAAPGDTWNLIAVEGEEFHLENAVWTRFCSKVRPNQCTAKRLEGGQTCEFSTFGVDPDPGIPKECKTNQENRAPGFARLTWIRSETFGVLYRVYVGEQSGVYTANYSAVASTGWGMAGIMGPKTLYFVVTAYFPETGEESVYSNEVMKVILAKELP